MFRRPRKGFTLVELLVVIAIIGILVGLLIPAVQRARAAARKIQCTNNMRNWSLAVLSYESAKQQLPGSQELMKTDVPAAPYIPVTWMGAVLDYVEQSDIVEFAKATAGGGLQPADLYIGIAVCPEWPNTSKGSPLNSYVANGGFLPRTTDPAPLSTPAYGIAAQRSANGLFLDRIPQNYAGGVYPGNVRVTISDIRDGTSHTLMLGENIQAGPWTQVGTLDPAGTALAYYVPRATVPISIGVPAGGRFFTTMVWLYAKESGETATEHPHISTGTSLVASIVTPTMKFNGQAFTLRQGQGPPTIEAARPSSFHSGGVNVFFADNSGNFLAEQIDYHVYQQLMTPYGVRSDMPYRRRILREGDYKN